MLTKQQAIDKMQALINDPNTGMYGWKLIEAEFHGSSTTDLILHYSYEILVHWATLIRIQREFDEYISLGNCIITPQYVRLRLNI